MRICHITSHLPPDQAANALLPYHLGCWQAEAGHDVSFIAHPARAGGSAPLPGPVAWMRPHRDRSALARLTRLAAVAAGWELVRACGRQIAGADVIHVHSNGLLPELGALVGGWKQRPVVLTLYGTEIWHYRSRRFGPDLFTRAYRRAAHVTFYSRGLLARARELGLARDGASVIYPPVADLFAPPDEGRLAVREALGVPPDGHLLLNVKRLHPLGGHRYLLDAMPAILRAHPRTRLVICGTGPLLGDLQARAVRAAFGGRVVFAGLLDNATVARYCAAADLFVLPSLLEACPTVALEALACGTPVVSSDSPGGVELNGLFGDDVAVVPREDACALAAAVVSFLARKRRARETTGALLERDFRRPAVATRFETIYRGVARGGAE